MDLVEDLRLAVERGSTPPDVEPHPDERLVQQVARVRRVGPPRRHPDRQPRICERRVEPGVVERAERGDECCLHVVGDARGCAEMSWDGREPSGRLRLREGRPEPREVLALSRGAIAEGDGGPGIVRWIGPRDAHGRSEPLQHPSDEPVVPGPRRDRLRGDLDLPRAVRDQHHGRRRDVEVDMDAGVSGRVHLAPDRSDHGRVLGAEPRLDIVEQALGRRRSPDRAALRSRAGERDRGRLRLDHHHGRCTIRRLERHAVERFVPLAVEMSTDKLGRNPDPAGRD